MGFLKTVAQVTLGRRIEKRPQAEQLARRLGQMYAALNQTNEAILHARTPEALYQKVCDAAVHGSKFLAATILIAEPDQAWLRVVGTTGMSASSLQNLRISVDENLPEGRGLAGVAYRTQRPAISNDFFNDERAKPWLDKAQAAGYRAVAGLPLLHENQVIGVLVFYSGERGAFDAEMTGLLQRLADNVSYALTNFEREEERQRTARITKRLGKMYAALSDMNAAILGAKSLEQLYQKMCDAIIRGGKFKAATVFVLKAGEPWLEAVGTSGTAATTLQIVRISTDPSHPTAKATVGTAFRTQLPCISNDYLNDKRVEYWWEIARKAGYASTAALPFLCQGRSAGVLSVWSDVVNEFDHTMVLLLQRLAENIAFALDKFQQEAERQLAENALRESEMRFRSLTELSSDWYWELDQEFRFTRLEGGCAEGDETIPAESSLGRCRWETGLEMEHGWDAHHEHLLSHQSFRDIEMHRRLADGARHYISISGEPMFDRERKFMGYRGVGKDITPRKRAEERIQFLATHDGLTGLPNRLMFSQILNIALQSAQRHARKFGVIFIDLDGFKAINDTLGHATGDVLLKQMAARFNLCLRGSDTVARLGGDEFVLLIQEVNQAPEVAAVAQRILAAANKPVLIFGQSCNVTASIGISIYPTDADNEQDLMKNADIAMYLAKEKGKNNYQFYAPDLKMKTSPNQSGQASEDPKQRARAIRK